MNISLCMIVKNEEQFLAKCLSSVQGVVDEIIIVDTGSTDKTLEIARDFASRIYNYPWRGDFSEARNFSLAQAKGEWILFLDADEELAPNQKDLISDAILRNAEGIQVQLINFFSNKPHDFSTDLICRLFKNNPSYRFSGKLHEKIIDAIYKHNPEAKIYNCAHIKIYHYGYLPKVISQRKKSERNLTILMEHKNFEAGPFENYIAGCEFFQKNDYNTSLNYFRRSLSQENTDLGFKSDLLLKTALCYKGLGQFCEASALISKAQIEYPSFTDLYYVQGLIFWDLRDYDSAILALNKCISLGEAPLEFSTFNGVGTFRAFFTRGLIWEDKLCFKNALKDYLLALQAKSDYTEPLTQILLLFKEWFTPDEGISFLKSHLDCSNASTELFLAAELIKLGAPKAAITFLSSYQDKAPDSPEEYFYYLLGKAYFYEKEFHKSEACFNKLLAGSTYGRSSLLYLFAINCNLSHFAKNHPLLHGFILQDLSPKFKDTFILLNSVLQTKQISPSVGRKVEELAESKEATLIITKLLELFSMFTNTGMMESLTLLKEILIIITDYDNSLARAMVLKIGNLLYSKGYRAPGGEILLQALQSDNYDLDSLVNLHLHCLEQGFFNKAEEIKELSCKKYNCPKTYAKLLRNLMKIQYFNSSLK